jgi:hypothetical protein
MIRPVAVLSFISCLLVAAVVEAAYVIKLKNGKEILTTRYWQEGGQILFDAYGGTFGVDKGSIAAIEQSSKTVIVPTNPQELAAAKTSEASAGEAASGVKKAPTLPGDEVPVKSADDPIIKDFRVLQERFKGLSSMLTSELHTFSEQITRFKERVHASKNFNDYLLEMNQADQMSDALEQRLKSRR